MQTFFSAAIIPFSQKLSIFIEIFKKSIQTYLPLDFPFDLIVDTSSFKFWSSPISIWSDTLVTTYVYGFFFDFQTQWHHLFGIRKRHSIFKKSFRTQHFSRNYFFDFKKSKVPWMKNNTTVNNKQQKQYRGFILLYQRNLAHPLSSSLALRSALLIGSTLALSHFALSPREV